MATRRKPVDLVCWSCGAKFQAKRQTAFLCSGKCRQAWRRAKLRGKRVKHLAAVEWDELQRYFKQRTYPAPMIRVF